MARQSKKSAQQPAGRRNNAPAAGPNNADAPQGRVAQMRGAWKMTREADPKLPLKVLGPALSVLVVLVVVGVVLGGSWVILLPIMGVVFGLLTGTSIFGRRVTSTVHSTLEGQAGGAAGAIQMMRGDWRLTPAVGFTRNQELVHRVIGRAGVILVGEGPSTAAIRQLITDQKRRIGRVAPDTPIHDVIVGEGEGRISIRKLQPTLVKLPRKLKQKEVNAVEARMKALGGANVPVPKGPMPTRVPRRQMRG